MTNQPAPPGDPTALYPPLPRGTDPQTTITISEALGRFNDATRMSRNVYRHVLIAAQRRAQQAADHGPAAERERALGRLEGLTEALREFDRGQPITPVMVGGAL